MPSGPFHPQIQASQLIPSKKPLVIDVPALPRHQDVNPSEPVPHPRGGDLCHPLQDQLFFWAGNALRAVDGPPLVQNGAGAPFTDPVPRPQVIHQDAALGWLQSFF